MILSDKALEMINELTYYHAKGIGKEKQSSRELIVKTTVYKDTGHLLPKLGSKDAPKYDTVPTLIDSRCTGTAMDAQWAKTFNVKLHKYLMPIPVFNVDGTLNKAGEITHYTKILVQMGGHVRQVHVAISDFGTRPLILGYNWLKKYNPNINWMEELIMIQEDYPTQKEEDAFAMRGLFTEKDGETMYALDINMYLQAKETKANAIVADKFKKALNGAKKATLPEQYKDYIDIFSKEGFNSLLAKRPWDHAIQLKDSFQPVNCKVYPLNRAEQKQLADFIDENLESKHI